MSFQVIWQKLRFLPRIQCVKFLLELTIILEFQEVKEIFMPGPSLIYNEIKAFQWSKCSTTNGLHHVQMKENCIRENIAFNFVIICLVDGKVNQANIFTKEMKDSTQFVELCNRFLDFTSCCMNLFCHLSIVL